MGPYDLDASRDDVLALALNRQLDLHYHFHPPCGADNLHGALKGVVGAVMRLESHGVDVCAFGDRVLTPCDQSLVLSGADTSGGNSKFRVVAYLEDLDEKKMIEV